MQVKEKEGNCRSPKGRPSTKKIISTAININQFVRNPEPQILNCPSLKRDILSERQPLTRKGIVRCNINHLIVNSLLSPDKQFTKASLHKNHYQRRFANIYVSSAF